MSAPPGDPSRRVRGGEEAGRGGRGMGGGSAPGAAGGERGTGPGSRGGRGRGGGGGRASTGGSNGPGEAQAQFWEQRRATWLAPPTSQPTLTSSAPVRPTLPAPTGLLPRLVGTTRYGPPHPHPGRQRLEQLLSVDNAEADEGIWSSIRQVWQRLTAGTQLSTPLPLGMVVRILRGGWIRDGTWPINVDGPAAVAEETGEETGNGHGRRGGGNGGNEVQGHGQGVAQGQGVVEQLPPVVEETLEDESTPTTEVSEGTVLEGAEFGGGGM